MRRRHRFAASLALLLTAALCNAQGAASASTSAGQPQSLQPLTQVNSVGQQFSKLLQTFDDLALKADADAFRDAVDKLSRKLYDMEFDSRQLVRKLPNAKPVGTEKDSLVKATANLLDETHEVEIELRDVGADLRRKDGTCLEGYVDRAAAGKEMAANNVQTALQAFSNWNAAALRAQLIDALQDVHAAQVAASAFANELTVKSLPSATPAAAANCYTKR